MPALCKVAISEYIFTASTISQKWMLHKFPLVTAFSNPDLLLMQGLSVWLIAEYYFIHSSQEAECTRWLSERIEMSLLTMKSKWRDGFYWFNGNAIIWSMIHSIIDKTIYYFLALISLLQVHLLQVQDQQPFANNVSIWWFRWSHQALHSSFVKAFY